MSDEGARALPRRSFLVSAGAGGLALTACAKHGGAEDISPTEDLMREHGILRRLLLVYESALGGPGFQDLTIFSKAADLVRRFVEDYHEKTEEELVFPRFEAKNRLVPLVSTLRKQHQRGRALTEEIARLGREGGPGQAPLGERMRTLVSAFSAMYRPHAAREDTILFPTFRELLSEKEYDDLGERFEDREHQLFGEHGFEHVVEQVGALETAAGCSDLDRFTPA